MTEDENFVSYEEPPIKDLVEEFKYKIKPTDTHRQLLKEIEGYYKNNEKFMIKHNLEAGKRARKHLLNIWHLVKERRHEIADGIYRGDENESRTTNN